MSDETPDADHLGSEFTTWAIKDFSAMLRRQITAAARRRGATIADFLHGHFHRFGIDGDEFNPVNLHRVAPSPDRPVSPSGAAWQQWADIHHRAKTAGMPDYMLAALRRQACLELGITQPKPPARRTEQRMIADQRPANGKGVT